jgi:hypothetical protein
MPDTAASMCFSTISEQKFLSLNFNVMADEERAVLRPSCLTGENFWGISSRACGPWRTVPGVSAASLEHPALPNILST